MLINVDADESRVAITEDGRLENLELETRNHDQVKGNVYKGVVHKVEASFQAAFVDFGADKQGFLPLSEIHPNLYPKGVDKNASIIQILKPKQELLVQVVRDEIGNKGATLSTHLSVPGRYLVLISESDKSGISRKISDDDRDRLKEILKDMEMPKGFGTIVRTAGTECSEEELHKDLAYLTKMWEIIQNAYDVRKKPGLLYEDRGLAVRSVRDYFTEDITEVLIDDPIAHQEVLEFVGVLMPQFVDVFKHYMGSVPLFINQGIEDQIEEVFSRKVPLRSGGSIVIDSTEALVAVDVNSGRVKGDGIEETAYTTNLEAAREIARQVIIRDLGGLIIVDFIDMRDRKRIREVEDTLRDAFKNDKARRKFARISEFGLLEMSRQRLSSTLMRASFDRCNHCNGQGVIRTPDSAGMYLLRRLREVTAGGRLHQVVVRAPTPVANFLLNRKRRDLYTLEVERRVLVEVHADPDLLPTEATLEFLERHGRGKPTQTVQKIDLVQSEVVRRESGNAKRGDVIFRDIPEAPNFGGVYKEIEDNAAEITSRAHASRLEAETRRLKAEQERSVVLKSLEPSFLERIAGWMKGLFGGAKKTEAESGRPRRTRSDSTRGSERSRDRDRDRDRDRNRRDSSDRRGGRGSRGRKSEGARGESRGEGRGARGERKGGRDKAAASNTDAKTTVASAATSGEDGPVRRRRRRRGRRGRGASVEGVAGAAEATMTGAPNRETASAAPASARVGKEMSSGRSRQGRGRGSASTRNEGASSTPSSDAPRAAESAEKSSGRAPEKSADRAPSTPVAKPAPAPIPRTPPKAAAPPKPASPFVIDLRGGRPSSSTSADAD